jgi:hypothetical protein
MNGMTAVYPLFRPNLCQCGHDLVRHTIVLGGTPQQQLCADCIFTLGTQNRHSFASPMETIPALSFVASGQYAYINCGGFGQGFVMLSTNAANVPAGSNEIPVPSLAPPVKIGITLLTITAPPSGSNPGNQAQYQVIGLDAGTTSIIVTPNLLFNLGAATPLIFFGYFGSTMGPGLPANYQRAG